jgi:hypothetical protein
MISLWRASRIGGSTAHGALADRALRALQQIPLTWRHIPHARKSCCIVEG